MIFLLRTAEDELKVSQLKEVALVINISVTDSHVQFVMGRILKTLYNMAIFL